MGEGDFHCWSEGGTVGASSRPLGSSRWQCVGYCRLKRSRICGTTSHQLVSLEPSPRTRSIRAFQLEPVASGSWRQSTTVKSLRLECLASCSSSCKSSATMSISERATNVPMAIDAGWKKRHNSTVFSGFLVSARSESARQRHAYVRYRTQRCSVRMVPRKE